MNKKLLILGIANLALFVLCALFFGFTTAARANAQGSSSLDDRFSVVSGSSHDHIYFLRLNKSTGESYQLMAGESSWRYVGGG